MALVDEDGTFVWDLPLLQLIVTPGETALDDLVGEADPVTVDSHARVREVAERLVEARRLSVVVVENDRPVGPDPGRRRARRPDPRAGPVPLPATAAVRRGAGRERRRRREPVQVPEGPGVPDLPGGSRSRPDRRQRRQRRRRGGHLRLGRRPVRLPAALLHGPGHHRLRLRPGDGGPAGGPHRQGPGRADPGAVLPPAVGLRHRGLRHRQHRAWWSPSSPASGPPSSCSASPATCRCRWRRWPSGPW